MRCWQVPRYHEERVKDKIKAKEKLIDDVYFKIILKKFVLNY